MIEVSHLTKRYGERTAVQDLSFEIKRGEIVGFLGPNGAGKSTTMKIITGFMPATQGQVKVGGFDVFNQPIEVKKITGYLPETPPVYPEMKVQDYLDFTARIHGVPRNQLKSMIDTAIQKTNLGEVRHRLIRNLSKGFQQRVGLAQALVHNPPVLILDEPTVGLDPKQIIEIRELIKGLGGDHTIILSSHILPEVTATCERIIVINRGKIAAEDTIEGLALKMKGGLLFTLEVKNPSEQAMKAIHSVPGVKSINAVGHRWVIELHPHSPEVRDQIVAAAVQSGAGVFEFSSEKISLEEIFLQLTTEEGKLS
jgi:ABC-2 type transport system ATP-binding protein